MMEQKIKIIIKKDGTLEYTVQGIKGKSCRDVTAFIDKIGRVSETKNTSEFNQTPDNKDRERN